MSIADRDIPYVDIRESNELVRIKNTLDQDPDVRKELLGFPVDTIVIDTIDEIQRILVTERLREKQQSAMQLQDWGWLKDQMTTLMRGFRNIPIHVVFTCHIKEVTDNSTGAMHYKPDLQGGFSDQVAGYVDLSLLISTKVEKEIVGNKLEDVEYRSLVSAPNSKYPFLKDRSGKLPSSLEVNFKDDFSRINSLIFENVDLKASVEYEVDTPQDTKDVPPEQLKEEPKVAPTTEKEEVKSEPEGSDDVKPLNKMPEGVTPQSKGYGVNYFCVSCGDELESEQKMLVSRAKHRKILCGDCIDKKND